MRPDMTKKFLEPDGGSRKYYRRTKKFRVRGEDEPIDPRGMRRRAGIADLDSDSHGGTDFSLLRRFLRRQVGRPWDEVYSEICQEADARSYKGHNFRQWLNFEVDTRCRIDEDGTVVNDRGFSVERYGSNFYVHPETGLLSYTEKSYKFRDEKTQTVFELDDLLYYKHDGLWYRVRFEKVPRTGDRRYGGYSFFGIADQFVSLSWGEHNWVKRNMLEKAYGLDKDGDLRYCCWKQSANHREIEKLKAKYGVT